MAVASADAHTFGRNTPRPRRNRSAKCVAAGSLAIRSDSGLKRNVSPRTKIESMLSVTRGSLGLLWCCDAMGPRSIRVATKSAIEPYGKFCQSSRPGKNAGTPTSTLGAHAMPISSRIDAATMPPAG